MAHPPIPPYPPRHAGTGGTRDVGARGFTLIEILIVLALAGLILATLGQGLSLLRQVRSTEIRALGRRDELDAVERTLRALIERLDPGGISGLPPAFRGEAGTLAFTTSLPSAAAGQITRLADVRVTLDPSHRMVMAWSPHLPNLLGAGAAPGRTTLLEEVERLEFAYWRPVKDNADGAWLTRWTEREVPRLIRIRIVPRNGGKAFPDIVAGPARDRWRP